MATFDAEGDLSEDLAFRLMLNTSVTLFWRPEILEQVTNWLSTHGYQLIHLNAAEWTTEDDLHHGIAQAFGFPDYYGENLDALRDCMRDVVDQDYCWSHDATGLVVVFTSYDTIARTFPRSAQIVLDIMAEQSRSASLFGRRMMCLVQSNDPNIRFEPVGAMPVSWNDAEWLNSKRRVD